MIVENQPLTAVSIKRFGYTTNRIGEGSSEITFFINRIIKRLMKGVSPITLSGVPQSQDSQMWGPGD